LCGGEDETKRTEFQRKVTEPVTLVRRWIQDGMVKLPAQPAKKTLLTPGIFV
jgi:hypothetical protein